MMASNLISGWATPSLGMSGPLGNRLTGMRLKGGSLSRKDPPRAAVCLSAAVVDKRRVPCATSQTWIGLGGDDAVQ